MSAPIATLSSSRRAEILDSAEPLFARHGFAGVGLSEVAESVGVGKSSLFHHFPSKVRLYTAVIERVLDEVDARLEARAAQKRSPLARMHEWTDAFVDVLTERKTWAPLLLRSIFEEDIVEEEDRERLNAKFKQIIGRIGGALREGIDLGEIRPVSIPQTIQTLIGMTVFHFASGDLGADILEDGVYAPEQVELRKAHIHDYLDHALATHPK